MVDDDARTMHCGGVQRSVSQNLAEPLEQLQFEKGKWMTVSEFWKRIAIKLLTP